MTHGCHKPETADVLPRQHSMSLATRRCQHLIPDTMEVLATIASSNTLCTNTCEAGPSSANWFLRTTCSSGRPFSQHQGASLPSGLELHPMMYCPGECVSVCVSVCATVSESRSVTFRNPGVRGHMSCRMQANWCRGSIWPLYTPSACV